VNTAAVLILVRNTVLGVGIVTNFFSPSPPNKYMYYYNKSSGGSLLSSDLNSFSAKADFSFHLESFGQKMHCTS
jgi:hypothetical protein